MSFNKDKSGSDTSSQQQQSTRYTQTPEEIESNKMDLERKRASQAQNIELDRLGGKLISQLLAGDENLPGFLGKLPAGIDEDVTQSIVDESLRDITPSFQSSGLLDSGVRASVSARTAGDIRRNVAEFNLGNLFNLLNLGVGGQAQVQQPGLANASLLSQRLSGLRGVDQTGSFSGQTRGFTSPSFLTRFNQFQTAAGQNAAKAATAGGA